MAPPHGRRRTSIRRPWRSRTSVCRVDTRGTGSSTGVAVAEYPPSEADDLGQVIAWLAAQPWCTGAVGMYGTSYAGFNTLHTAMARPPALRAIMPIFATDDRYTDDIHFGGGVRKAGGRGRCAPTTGGSPCRR